MKGLKCRYKYYFLSVISLVFSALFGLFVSSSNVNAVDFTTSVEATGYSISAGNINCIYSTFSVSGNDYCNVSNTDMDPQYILMQMVSTADLFVTEGNYYETTLYLRHAQIVEPRKRDVLNKALLWNVSTNSNFSVVHVSTSYEMDAQGPAGIGLSCSATSGDPASSPQACQDYTAPYIYAINIILRANVTGHVTFVLGDGHNILAWLNTDLYPQHHFPNWIGETKLGHIVEYRPKADSAADAIGQQNKKDEEDRQNIDNQQSEASSDADSSQSDAESTGTTLLAAFTAFVDALNNSSPTDCNINFNIMNGFNGGNVNLCRLSVPSSFQVIGSLVLIGFCVPLSIATARKVIDLFRSFQS